GRACRKAASKRATGSTCGAGAGGRTIVRADTATGSSPQAARSRAVIAARRMGGLLHERRRGSEGCSPAPEAVREPLRAPSRPTIMRTKPTSLVLMSLLVLGPACDD